MSIIPNKNDKLSPDIEEPELIPEYVKEEARKIKWNLNHNPMITVPLKLILNILGWAYILRLLLK